MTQNVFADFMDISKENAEQLDFVHTIDFFV